MQKITALMNKINGLDLDFKQIKDQLNQVSNKLKDVVTSEEAKGFLVSYGKVLRISLIIFLVAIKKKNYIL